MEKREKLLEMIKELVAIPSISESKSESLPGRWIYERLSKLNYFVENPEQLRLVHTPLEGSSEELYSLVARVDASVKTDRTVLFISHYDVVPVDVYGELREHAFDPDYLTEYFGADKDKVLYGRGVMDMKAGVAVEVDLIEDFCRNRDMFDVNIVVAFVGDEENTSAGARGAAPVLAEMKRNGTDFLAAINTEPGEAGCSGCTGPKVFLGTLGKIMPSFYVKGLPSHVGGPFSGFSSALCIADLVCRAENNPTLTDPLNGVSQPSWICLDMASLREGYSVTLPDRAYAYFNCFTSTLTPAKVMKQMKKIAEESCESVQKSYEAGYKAIKADGFEGEPYTRKNVKVYTLEEIMKIGRESNPDFDKQTEEFLRALPAGDMRQRGIKLVDRMCDLAGAEGPFTVCFFLPPWMPCRTTLTDNERDMAVVRAIRNVEKEAEEKYGLKLKEIELFSGLCDLSYVGASADSESTESIKHNMPGWGSIYSVPVDDMNELGMPVVNLGPSGADPHKKEERLFLEYSLEVLPELVRKAVREISEETI